MGNMLKAEDMQMQVIENEIMENKDTGKVFALHEKIRGSLTGGNPRDKNYKTWEIILNHLQKQSVGSFYDDGNLYFFRKRDKRLLQISSEQEDTSRLMNSEFGIIPSDPIFEKMVKNILGMTYEFKPKKTNLKKTAHYCNKRNAAYLSIDESTVMKITKDSVEQVYNGYDDVIFYTNKEYFINDFKYDDSIELDYIVKHSLDANYEETGKLKGEDVKRLVNAWLLSFFLPEISNSRMILVAHGEAGSFKTTFAKKLGWILKGETIDTTAHDDKTDMNNITTNKTFVALDNIETKANTQFLDQLARVATGTTISKRKLYTTNEVLEFKPQVNVCITAMTPTFRRPDVVERLLLVKMEKRDEAGYLDDDEIKEHAISERDKNMSCIVNQIQYLLKKRSESSNKWKRSKMRMASFGTLLMQREGEEKANDLMEKLKEVQIEYAEEFLTLPDILDNFLNTKCVNNSNEIKGMRATELYTALKIEAQNMRYPFKIGSAEALGKELAKETYKKRFNIDDKKRKDGKYYFISHKK